MTHVCANCQQEIPDGEEHSFGRFGFEVAFHAECCPGEVEAVKCERHCGKCGLAFVRLEAAQVHARGHERR